MSDLVRSVVKASAAKVKGGRAIDAKYHGTHQIAEQAIVVRENEGRANNHRPIYLSLGTYPNAALLSAVCLCG